MSTAPEVGLKNVVPVSHHSERALATDRRPPAVTDDATSVFAVVVDSVDDAPTLEAVEMRYIAHVLRMVGGNKTRAAEVLQVDRRTLYRRLARKR